MGSWEGGCRMALTSRSFGGKRRASGFGGIGTNSRGSPKLSSASPHLARYPSPSDDSSSSSPERHRSTSLLGASKAFTPVARLEYIDRVYPKDMNSLQRVEISSATSMTVGRLEAYFTTSPDA